MSTFLLKVKRALLRLRALFPSRLPVGMEEHKAWADSLIFIYDIPDNDSVRFAIAVAILHSGEATFYRSIEYFGRMMLKGAANEVAGAVVQELKTKQQERIAKQTIIVN